VAVRGYAAPVPRPAAAAPETPRPLTRAAGPAGAGPADGGADTKRIRAVDRAVALLKSVAASATPPTVLELARDCGINRSTAWRLLRTLEHHGLVDRDPITQRYTVGYGAISVAPAVTDDALVRRVRPLPAKLAVATGESVTLAVAKRFRPLIGAGLAAEPGVGDCPMAGHRFQLCWQHSLWHPLWHGNG
jgi:IclR-like helix-turn-helix domain-containing protein